MAIRTFARRLQPSRRFLGVAVTAAASIGLLSACDKPLPGVTVLSGSTTTVVRPQTYCFDAQHCHFPDSKVSQISAKPGAKLLVDVPRAISTKSWSVTSAAQSSTNVFRAIAGAEYTSSVHDTHSTTVVVPNSKGSYFLVIRAGGSSDGSWVAEVTIGQ